MLDPVGIRFFPYAGRDAERTPMPWHGGPGGGFTDTGRAAVAAHGRPGDQQRGGPGGRPVVGAGVLPPGDRDAARERRPGRRVVPVAALAGGHLGLRPGLGHPGAVQHVRRCRWVRGVGARERGALLGRRDFEGSAVEGSLRLAPWGGVSRGTAAGAGVVASIRRRYVLCTTPAQGHTAPLLALARRLVDEGHDVVFFTTRHYRDKVTATGASFVPFAEEYDAHDLMVANPERESSSKRGVRGVKDDLRRIFIGPIPGPVPGPADHSRGEADRRHRGGLDVPRRPATRPRSAGSPGPRSRASA